MVENSELTGGCRKNFTDIICGNHTAGIGRLREGCIGRDDINNLCNKNMKFVTVYFSVFFLALTVAVSPAHAKQILVFGDSLSSGYGITEDEGWVAKLADLLVAEHKVANASVSGEDTVTGLVRLPALLELNEPDLVIIELGGNDGLRAYQLEKTRENLDKMISLAKKSGAKVVLAGIRIPPNYGPRYTQGFANLFPELAREQQVAFLNMYIEDIVLDSKKMQSDGIHPAANAQPEIANYVHEFLLEENLLNE